MQYFTLELECHQDIWTYTKLTVIAFNQPYAFVISDNLFNYFAI